MHELIFKTKNFADGQLFAFRINFELNFADVPENREIREI